MPVNISLSSREDLPALAEVNRSAYSLELPTRFAHHNWADTNYMFNFFKGRLELRFDDKGTQVFKASDADTGKIVGFACWTHEPATSQVSQTPTSAMMQKLPASFNIEFMKTVGADVETLREHMKGEDHYCRSMTLPQRGES